MLQTFEKMQTDIKDLLSEYIFINFITTGT